MTISHSGLLFSATLYISTEQEIFWYLLNFCAL